MRSALTLGTMLLAASFLMASDPRPDRPTKPFGIDHRIPWTTSHVVGSPNPPLPYHVVRTFRRLHIPCPIAIAHEPGTHSLIVLYQLFPWSGAGRIVRIKDDPRTDKMEELLALDGIAYGIAFHPDYLKNGYVYIGSNGPLSAPPRYTRVTRYTVSRRPPYRLDPQSAKVIIEWLSDGHNGGDLAFGNDGMLYVSSGDGTSDSDGNVAGQDLSRLLSKVLRIDVDHPDRGKAYSVPPDNPFVGVPGARPETWAYGFRNPWRLHIDKATGDLWVGQNGQDLWEQAYLVRRGANYGWSVYEGSHPFYLTRKRGPTPISPPTVEHPHSEMRSLTGGVVYRGRQLPELRGAYLYGDWSTGKIWGVRHDQGKVIWHKLLAETTLQITGFGTDSKGELLIADHGGGIYRLEPTPLDPHPAHFPTRLSETGLFLSVKDDQPQPGLIPYSVNAPLWSDGAAKERFIALPGTSQIDFTVDHGWNFSDGAVLVKTFSLPLAGGGLRRIETRLLTKQLGQWAGYSYIWNEDQTDATLVEPEGLDHTYEVRDEHTLSGVRQQTWHYPSRTECMVCHSRAANFVLGPSTSQMNKVHAYGKIADNQLRTLEHLGVFHINDLEHLAEFRQRARDVLDRGWELAAVLTDAFRPFAPTVPQSVTHVLGPLGQLASKARDRLQSLVLSPVEAIERELSEHPRYTTRLPRRPEAYARLVNPYDPHANLEMRVRSYLHANCAICHVLAGGGNAMIDLDFTTARDRMKLVDEKPLHDSFGIAGARLVKPGDPERSILYERIRRRGAGQMPPLASSVADEQAARLLYDWIKQLR